MTGIVICSTTIDNKAVPWGTVVAPNIFAPIHQHYFVVRMETMIDGIHNSISEVNVEPFIGKRNTEGNAFMAKTSLLQTEKYAKRDVKPKSHRYWKITNNEVTNYVNQPVSYLLLPGENSLPFATDNSSIIKRAGFIKHHLWVTPYNRNEKFPAGNYPNQHQGGDGLPKYTKANRNIVNEELVLWYVAGATHVPRVEDFPVMSVVPLGFSLKPSGFFDGNPSLDIPNFGCKNSNL